jgi:hypothetical protein
VGVYYANTAVQIGFVPLQHENVPLPQAQKIMDRTVLTWDDQIYSWYLDTAGNTLPDVTWAFLETGNQTLGALQLWYQDRGLAVLNGNLSSGSEGAAAAYGWDTPGIWSQGSAGNNPSYPLFTSFTIPDTTAVTVKYSFTYGNCNDLSVAVYQDGVIPEWRWNQNNTRIAASYNCSTPYIYGLTDSIEGSEGALTSGHTYTSIFTYDPTSGVSTLHTADQAGGLDETITLSGQALAAGNYRVGFAADQDNIIGPRSYWQNLSIAFAGSSYVYKTSTPPVIEPNAFTFDPYYTSPALVLSDAQPISGGNITITAANSISFPEGAVMYTAIQPGQKIMFSMTLDQSSGSGNENIGLASRDTDTLSYLGNDGTSIALWSTGNWAGATSGSGLYSYTTGDDIDVAVDFDDNLIWWATNGNPWNSDVGADPAAGTGGISLGTLTIDYTALYPAVSAYHSTDSGQWTVRNSPVRPIPTGFTFLSNP